jgi:hypothetical protein
MRLNDDQFFHSVSFQQNPQNALKDEAVRACGGSSQTFAHEEGCTLQSHDYLIYGGRPGTVEGLVGAELTLLIGMAAVVAIPVLVRLLPFA